MHWIALQPWLKSAEPAGPAGLAEPVGPAGPEDGSGQAAQDTQVPAGGGGGGGSPLLADALAALGWWALQFTPKVAQVAIEGGGGAGEGTGEGAGVLVMEVSASERLFGGRKPLLRRIYQSNKPFSHVRYAQAATSLIAIAKLQIEPSVSPGLSANANANANADTRRQPARPRDGLRGSAPDLLSGHAPHITPDTLSETLPNSLPNSLPLATLAAARVHLPTLARIGCTTWGQLRALPRGGVARRFGADLLDALDRAYGAKPEIYPWLTLPEVFEAKLELTARIDNAPSLMFGARRLLAQLQVWLQFRQRGILALELGWELDARRQDASTGHLVLRTAEPTLDMAHVQRLLAENLARVTLHAPALYLRLRSLETAALPGITTSLLPDDVRKGDSLHHLLERLSARLGAGNVLHAVPHADHRPERMQVWQAASAVSPGSPVSPLSRVAAAASTSVKLSNATNNIANYSYRTWGNGINDPLNHSKTGVQPLIRPLTRPLTRPLAQSLPRSLARSLARPLAQSPEQADALYPTWLLAQPLKLAVRNNVPQCAQGGPLTLLAGPQRVEAGWWSGQKNGEEGGTGVDGGKGGEGGGGGDASAAAPCTLRDYFLARSEHMGLLWIYRERLGGQGGAGQSALGRADAGGEQNADASDWYLHGLFA